VLAALLASPHVRRLYGLSLPNTDLGARDAARIAAWPALAELRELELPGNRIRSEGLEALAASAHLTRLRTLDLSDNSDATSEPTFTDAAVRALVDSPQLRNLETVRLRLTDISGPAWRSLLGRFGAGLMWDRTLPELDRPQADGR
jgi:Leucine-rich repeat (LRR) protein